MPRNQIQKSLFALLPAIMFFAGCGAINPLCSTARPKPGLTSLVPNPVALSQVEQGLLLTVNGSHFYLNSVILWNGAVLPTTVISSSQLQATITTTQISAPGTARLPGPPPATPAGVLVSDTGGNVKPLPFRSPSSGHPLFRRRLFLRV